MAKLYKKHFDSLTALDLEVKGYKFYQQYCTMVPALQGVSTESRTILYEALPEKTIAECLHAALPYALERVYEHLLELYKLAKNRESEGGTRLFYRDRTPLLKRPEFVAAYRAYIEESGKVTINGLPITPRTALLLTLIHTVDRFNYGRCVPSQGDYHERNLLRNGHIVDFEGAGWNLLVTDIATFIWHTMFAGNHFGPRYAKWAAKDTSHEHFSSDITLEGTICRYTLDDERKALLGDYLSGYLRHLKLSPSDHRDISYAIAFRLLTVFDPLQMSGIDRQLSFILANYFIVSECSLGEKLSNLLGETTVV